ncbi:hypothetical protein NLM33_07760 [Bradyrhizobium sp. CCGUVB1N3]|uniref:hypothetical protein n=1 Tax=Bradyrhizobium sp. CCGUVB1N3 TaxID=2949629 RepID=UPI0020B3EDE0|nr:hypothetical protein [Bradyrhizobium sp. CCGUVB1N3]MCP3470220.1 hypothetical protein [Bradyrhizobium sp. CCGUVB1N3]
MRQMILSVITAALIAGSASASDAAQHHHPVRKTEQVATSAPFRNANNAIAPAAQASWPYSGYSAPAGR